MSDTVTLGLGGRQSFGLKKPRHCEQKVTAGVREGIQATGSTFGEKGLL
jgi:hypothetical protein